MEPGFKRKIEVKHLYRYKNLLFILNLIILYLRVLKTGIRLEGVIMATRIWLTCYTLYNMY